LRGSVLSPEGVRPGERILLERNPHYWKSDANGERLPYLDEILFLVVTSEPAEVMR
jgi:peptide/nickel transport system substrate-binding protein